MRRLRFVLPLWLGCAVAHAVEIMQWERLPLAVPLHVDQERIIFIDQNVRVGVPHALADSLRVQSAGARCTYGRRRRSHPPACNCKMCVLAKSY